MCMNNNGLEGTNRVLKDTGTFHEQMPILEFLPALKAWIGSESRRRDPDNVNCIPFALVPDIGTKELTDGYALMQVAMAFIRIQDHYISVEDNTVEGNPFTPEIARLLYDQYRSNSFDSFDQYNSFQHKVHVVTPCRKCNCYQYGREFKCPHTIGIAILVDKIYVPDVAKGVLLGCKRQSGRPKLALDRYHIQDYSIDQKGVKDKSMKSKGTKRKIGSFSFPVVSKVLLLPDADEKALCQDTIPASMVTPISQEKSASSLLVPFSLDSIPMEAIPFLDLISMRYLPLDVLDAEKVKDALSNNHAESDKVTQGYGIPIYYRNLWTLRPKCWLVNDVSLCIAYSFLCIYIFNSQ